MKKILSIIFIVFTYLNYRNLELGFLQNYSPDGYAFHGSLLNMFEGVMSFDIKNSPKFPLQLNKVDEADEDF